MGKHQKKVGYPLRLTTYSLNEPGQISLSKSGDLWTISVDVAADEFVAFEMPTELACFVREFLADAVCSACAGRGEK